MTYTFKTATACTKARDLRAKKTMWGSGKKRGERQQVLQCATCKRWCYLADRCNLFTTISAPQHTGGL